MPTTAKVICDSISESGVRLTTLVLEYPRIIHAEFMTHRMFSRNASSSRAIPVEKQIERIENDPFVPKEWGSNKRGMQAGEQIEQIANAGYEWDNAKKYMLEQSAYLRDIGVHKQLANRLLEPFSHIQVIVTATEWEGFFTQRLHPAAQPEIQELAKVMKEAMDNSIPDVLEVGEWHLPFTTVDDETNLYGMVQGGEGNLEWISKTMIKLSVARCARVSYGLNDRGWGDIEKDLALYDMLATSGHWSPFEHQATPIQTTESAAHYDLLTIKGVTHVDYKSNLWSGNFKSWIQNRQLIQTSA